MASTIATKNFEIYAGDADEIVLVYTDSAGAPITTILSATITLRLSYSGAIVLQKTATLDAPNGKMTFTFSSAETAALVSTSTVSIPETKYIHDVQLALSSGLTPVTIIKGTATVTGDITR
jgi:hypothetical protein